VGRPPTGHPAPTRPVADTFPCSGSPTRRPQAGVLHYAKQITDAQAGGPIVDTVITVPAWFGIAQRQVGMRAADAGPAAATAQEQRGMPHEGGSMPAGSQPSLPA
jgi:hypothetical protein